MPQLPVVKTRRVVAAFERTGFAYVKRERGHIKLTHPNGRTVIVVDDGNDDYPLGTPRQMLTRAGITVAEFVALLK